MNEMKGYYSLTISSFFLFLLFLVFLLYLFFSVITLCLEDMNSLSDFSLSFLLYISLLSFYIWNFFFNRMEIREYDKGKD